MMEDAMKRNVETESEELDSDLEEDEGTRDDGAVEPASPETGERSDLFGSDGELEGDEHADMVFEDTVVLETTKDELWSFISDAENLYTCVPGAQEIERVSERKYTGTIERGVSRLTITIDGDVELVEMDEPDWIVADGEAFDSTTGSTFDGLAAMELSERDDRTVELAYVVELTFTGGAKRLTGGLVKSLVGSNIDTYFENIREEVEPDDAE